MTQRNRSRFRPGLKGKPLTLDESADNILRVLEETHVMLLENSAKLDAIMAHLGVPPKPPAGFVRD